MALRLNFAGSATVATLFQPNGSLALFAAISAANPKSKKPIIECLMIGSCAAGPYLRGSLGSSGSSDSGLATDVSRPLADHRRLRVSNSALAEREKPFLRKGSRPPTRLLLVTGSAQLCDNDLHLSFAALHEGALAIAPPLPAVLSSDICRNSSGGWRRRSWLFSR